MSGNKGQSSAAVAVYTGRAAEILGARKNQTRDHKPKKNRVSRNSYIKQSVS